MKAVAQSVVALPFLSLGGSTMARQAGVAHSLLLGVDKPTWFLRF